MIGMDKFTGKWLDGDEHIKQSLTTLVTTHIGERVMRRNIGLDLDLVDDIYTGGEDGQLAYAVADALDKASENRVELREVHFKHNQPQYGLFDIEMVLLIENQSIQLDARISEQ
jgi:phage baseplate assembly protein W